MKKIEVFIKDKNTLVLNEDATKGDYIDLTDLATVDTTTIESLIEEAKDKSYKAKLNEFEKTLKAEAKLEKEQIESKLNLRIQELENQLKNTNELNNANLKAKEKEKQDALALKSKELDNLYINKINELNSLLENQKLLHQNELDSLKHNIEEEYNIKLSELNKIIATNDANMKLELNSIETKNNEIITNLKNKYQEELSILLKKNDSISHEYEILKSKYELDIKNKELEINSKYQSQINDLKSINDLEKINNKNNIEILNLEHERKIQNIKQEYDNKISSLNNNILGLQRQRATMGSKMIGEDLEVWCTNEYLSFAQTGGLSNCVWTKDNIPVRYADEVHASKGDFILNCYATDEHKEETLLTSIIFEMKNESQETAKKHHNADFYQKLDENRNKKHCKYAVLVSDLDRGNNDLPMFRVLEYSDMYVVRPEYMMTFINIITSVVKRFVDLVLEKTKEELNLKSKRIILEEFDSIKNTYLEKPLESLSKDIDLVEKETNNIITSANKIHSSIEHIRSSYIRSIERKLETYTPKLNKLLKNIEE